MRSGLDCTERDSGWLETSSVENGVASVVILEAKVCDQILAPQMTQGILEFHQLNEDVVFGIQTRGRHWRFEIKRQPFLHALHTGALREVEEERQIQHDGRGKNRVAAEEIDLDLHLVAEPAEDVDVVPAFLVVAARWIVVDADDVGKVLVKLRVDFRLENVLKHRQL